MTQHRTTVQRYMRRNGNGSYWREECVPGCPACKEQRDKATSELARQWGERDTRQQS